MKTGLSTVCLQKRAETEAALEIINGVSAEVCEVYLQTFYEYRPEFARKYAANNAVFSVRVNPWNFETQLFSPSRRVRGDGYYWLDQTLRSAQAFGAKNFILQGLLNESVAYSADELANYLNEIISFCARYGVNTVLETNSKGLYNRPEVFSALKSRCPALTGALNLKQVNLSGYPLSAYLKDMQGAISFAYLSGGGENGEFCFTGQEKSEFKTLFSKLKDAGFDGAVIIDALAENVEELKTITEYINEIIYNV